MCTKTGRIISVKQANAEGEAKSKNDVQHYTYYWRTKRGQIRQKGYVWICACGKIERFSKTKKIFGKQLRPVIMLVSYK